MLRNIKLLLLSIFIITSCTAEKVNLSPASDFFSENKKVDKEEDLSIRKTVYAVDYASEVSDHISSFPKFQNTAVDNEVEFLKSYLNEYLYAVKSYNRNRKHRAYMKIQKSYSKIYHTAKFLKQEDKEVLNRYLTRIKTQIHFLENQSTEGNSTTLN